MKSVVVCDSEPIAVEGLRALLQSSDGLRVVAAEDSPAETVRAVREWQPRLVVFDKAFGLDEVTDSLRQLRELADAPAAVVWGASLTTAEAVRLLRAGASGVIRKTASLHMVAECLRSAAGGGRWVEDGLMVGAETAMLPARHALTEREQQVVGLVERGLSNKGIAAELGIRVGTVKIHLRHIFEKTGIRGRYGLALRGLQAKPAASESESLELMEALAN